MSAATAPLISIEQRYSGLSKVNSTPALFFSNVRTGERFLDFFISNIRNKNTRIAYFKATSRFSDWCGARGVTDLEQVKPVHVATYIEELTNNLSKPTAKQHLAAIRMLFDWLVVGQIMDQNPAHAVRGPKHVVKKGKTPVLTGDEARAVLEGIDASTVMGKRDRALIALMTYAFARIGAALKMRVEDYFVIGRRARIRLHEKGGKQHEVPCHHTLDEYLEDYVKASGIGTEPKGPLFRSGRGGQNALSSKPLRQGNAHRMIRRRAKAVGILAPIGNHTFRATGITAYLKNGGRLEIAQEIAAHESPRTTGLYDRRSDDVSLDEIERIVL